MTDINMHALIIFLYAYTKFTGRTFIRNMDN